MMAVFDKIDLPYPDEGNRRQLHAAPSRRRDSLPASLDVSFEGAEVGVEIGAASRANAAANLA
jgi:hypothetical protein